MCGICGTLNYGPDSEELLAKMVSTLHHRGPDEAGYYVDSDVALGHCRLSIVGIDDGIQPISNGRQNLWIVYNGEVFNYPELRADLIDRGHVFETGTDTEVLIHLYEEYGKRCLNMINGQFAFAIWDSTKKELFLARDRVGIRPLYYYRSGSKLLFASEIKGIFQDPAVPREIDPQALHQIFTYWTTLTPRTVFRNILELPPGHYQVIRNGRFSEPQAFWKIPYYSPQNRYQGSFGDATLELAALIQDATRLRLRADVPVGAYLSGGLDSSILTSLISRRFNNNLKTFSLGFQESAYSETSYQREMVKHLGTDHHELRITNQDICDNFPRAIEHCEKPLLRTAPVPMLLLSGMVNAQGCKVALTGEGADEVFGGYDIFKEDKIRRFWAKFPSSATRPRLLEKLHPYIFGDPARSRMILQRFYAVAGDGNQDPFHSHRIRWNNTGKNTLFFSHETQRRALESYTPEVDLLNMLPVDFDKRDPFSKVQFLEMGIFMTNYILSSQGDRMAMANSLELRVPFLDYRVIDFAAKLPPFWKIKGLSEKHILKKAFQDVLPPRISARPKQPFRAPIREVFFSGRNDYVEDMLCDGYLRETGYFDPARTRMLVDKYRNPNRTIASETQNMALVGILSTQILHSQFIVNRPEEDSKPIDITRKVIRSIHSNALPS